MTTDASPNVGDVKPSPRGWLAWVAGLSPRVTALIAAAWIIGFALSYALLPLRVSEAGDFARTPRILAFFVCMSVFYWVSVPAATRAALASIDELTCTDEEGRLELRGALVAPPWWWVSIFVGLASARHIERLNQAEIDFAWFFDPNVISSTTGLALLAGWLHIILYGVAFAVLARHTLLFWRLGKRLHGVDLLDHTPLAPFVRASFRTTLIVVGAFAGIAAFHVRWESDRSFDPLVASVLPGQVFITVALFLLPLWGVHQALRDARNQELTRVHAAIRGDRVALRDSLLAAHADSLSAIDLLTYREQVRSFTSWPFDSSTVVRLALLTGVPMAGWLGGALVERALGVVLD